MLQKSEYAYMDYIDRYHSIMQFNKNKSSYIHGWYPFVEGYSKDFIVDIIRELQTEPRCCLDPFAGSGTTPVELQKLRVKCFSFEVNPFMYNLAITKMRTDYTTRSFNKNYKFLSSMLSKCPKDISSIISPPIYRTITEREDLNKWNFNREVMSGLLDIKYAINQFSDFRYQNLFKIALASMLLEVSNVYRNGKTYSYKEDWESTVNYSRKAVHDIFLDRLENNFLPDIRKLSKHRRDEGELFSNHNNCLFGDSRVNLQRLKDNSIDLVITSPPYLNSRDYTDTYMIELWMLDHIRDYEALRELRRNTLRSHVQVVWDSVETLDIPELVSAVNELSMFEEIFWNKSLLNMIKGYFDDLNILFKKLFEKVAPEGKIYFNVANSAYYGVEIKTDLIVAQIAERNGFVVEEIRRARQIKPSSQQKDLIPYLWEVILVISKEVA